MYTNILLIAVFFCAVQELNGRPRENSTKPSPIEEAIKKIEPELDKITQRLKKLSLETNKCLLTLSTKIRGIISRSGEKTLEAINRLQAYTRETAELASKNNISVETCLSEQQAKLERVLMVANSKMMKTSEQGDSQIKNFTAKRDNIVGETEELETNLNKIIGYCIRQYNLPWHKEKLIGCLFSEAADINKIVDGLYEQKSSLESDSNTLCESENADQDSLLKWISSLQGEFLKCVAESEEYSHDSVEPPEMKTTEGEKTQESGETHVAQQDSSDKPGQFDQSQEIFASIEKLEFLLGQLKQIRQIKDMEDRGKTPTISEEYELDSPVSADSKKIRAGESSKERRPSVLYISL